MNGSSHHPQGRDVTKPCKTCGRPSEVGYLYCGKHLEDAEAAAAEQAEYLTPIVDAAIDEERDRKEADNYAEGMECDYD